MTSDIKYTKTKLEWAEKYKKKGFIPRKALGGEGTREELCGQGQCQEPWEQTTD